MIKTIAIATIMIITISCKNSKQNKQKAMKQILPVTLTNDFTTYSRNNAGTQIINATIIDSTLTLKVSYNGGCEVHSFEMIGSKMIQKSFPPIRGIKLIHNANNDQCRELIEQDLRFNISDFGYKGGSIMLNLEGWKQKLKFETLK